MMQEMTRVTSSSNPYMILEPVEFLQLGQSAQPAVQAVLVKQQAREVRLSIPPILPRISSAAELVNNTGTSLVLPPILFEIFVLLNQP